MLWSRDRAETPVLAHLLVHQVALGTSLLFSLISLSLKMGIINDYPQGVVVRINEIKKYSKGLRRAIIEYFTGNVLHLPSFLKQRSRGEIKQNEVEYKTVITYSFLRAPLSCIFHSSSKQGHETSCTQSYFLSVLFLNDCLHLLKEP